MSEGEPIPTGEAALASFTNKVRGLITSLDKNTPATITNPQLRAIARLVAQPRNQNPGRLQHFLNKGDDYYLEHPELEEEWGLLASVINTEKDRLKLKETEKHVATGISPETEMILRQAGEAINKVAETQAKMARGEQTLDLPESKEIRGRYVRAILDGIENSNRDCHDFSISMVVKNLEASLPQLEKKDPGLAREVKARLAVHDSSELIKQAGGWISRDVEKVGPGFTIGSAVTEAKRREHNLNRDTIRLFLKEGLSGLNIAAAWNILQEACFNYQFFVNGTAAWLATKGMKKLPFRTSDNDLRELLDDEVAHGKVATNYWVDSDSVRREYVRNYLIQQLGGGEQARKSLQLAEKLAIATLETSVFNRTAMGGNDELAEIIGLKGWRTGRASAGRNRGPEIHLLAIDGFGSSWLRQERFVEGQTKTDAPLKAESIKIEEIGAGNYEYFCTVIVSRLDLLKGLLLERRPVPWPEKGHIDISTLQSAVVFFNTADKPIIDSDEEEVCFKQRKLKLAENISETEAEKQVAEEINAYLAQKKCGPRKLRVLWLLGVVDVALAYKDLGWTGEAFAELAIAATKEKLSSEAGSFITLEQWEWIERQTRLYHRLPRMVGRRSSQQYTQRLATKLGK